MGRKDYDAAADLLDRAYRADPSKPVILKDLAVVLASAGKIDEAAVRYKQYLAIVPTDDAAALAMATTLSWSKDAARRAESERLLTDYMAKHPDSDEALLQRARVRSWSGLVDQADVDYRAYLAKHDKQSGAEDVWLELATALAGSESHLARALEIYDRHLAAHPTDWAILLRRARALVWMGDYRHAEPALRELAESAKTPADESAAETELARVYAQTGRRYQAVDLLEEVLARDPKNDDARAERDRLAVTTGTRVEPKLFFYGDKSKIRILAATAEARAPILPRRFGILAEGGSYSLGTAQETLLVGRANLGIWARQGPVEIEGAMGPRFYQIFDTKVGGRGAVRVTPNGWSTFLLTYQYDDIYFDMLQPASVAAQIRGHAVFLTSDVTLPKGVRLTGRLGTRVLSPDNKDLDATGTVYVPIAGPFGAGYIGQYITWQSNDPSYWSPQAFAAHLGFVRVARSYYRLGFSYDVQGVLGIAGERILGVPEAGFGPSFGASGAFTYTPTPRLDLRLSAQYQQTVRDIPSPPVGGVIPGAGPPPPTTSSPQAYYWITGTASAIVYF
jgi:tetratricopeptide (TPR) repeat protein